MTSVPKNAPIAGMLLALLCMLTAPSARAECRMVELGRFPVNLHGNQIHIKGLLNGVAVSILVDTGAAESMITYDAAMRAGLKPAKEARYRMVGVSGKTDMYRTRVDELIIGNYRVANRVWPVLGPGSPALADVGMVLGADFWSKLDLEINLPERELVLWDNKDCGKAALAYWNPNFMLALLADTPDKMRADAQIAGHTVRAMIDTGAGVTFINRRIADRVGYRQDPDGAAEGEVKGIGNSGPVDSHIGVFDSFTLGDLTVKNARLRIINMEEHTQETGTRLGGSIVDFDNLVIGADFLLANRVLIANSQHYLYMTYEGGPVFQGSAPQLVATATDDAASASTVDDMLAMLPRSMTQSWVDALESQKQGDPARTEALFRAVLEEVRARGKAGTRDEILPRYSIAGALAAREMYAESAQERVQLQELVERHLGAESAMSVWNLVALAEMQLRMHRYEDAVRTTERALPGAEKVYGAGSEGEARVLEVLGTAVEAAGDYDRADDIYGRLLAGTEARNGPAHPDTARALINVGRMAETRERYDEAISNYQRARAIFAAAPDQEHMVENADRYLESAREAAAQ